MELSQPDKPVAWSTKDDFHLTWRTNTRPNLTALQVADFLEWTASPDDMTNGTIAPAFTFKTGHLSVFNAPDENGLHTGPKDTRWHHHPITR